MSIEDKKIGIMGARGLLGGDLVEYFSSRAKVLSITRDNYDTLKGEHVNVLINANGNSRRFWANQYPLEDFEASTASVYRSLFDFKFDTYIYISSVDAYADHSGPTTTREDMSGDGKRDPYGHNKFLAEQIVKNYAPSHIIMRLATVLGSGLKKGLVYDMLKREPLFVSHDTRLQYITTEAIGGFVESLLRRDISGEMFNVGGKGVVPMSDFTDIFGYEPVYRPDAAIQQVYEMTVKKASQYFHFKSSREYLEEFVRSRRA